MKIAHRKDSTDRTSEIREKQTLLNQIEPIRRAIFGGLLAKQPCCER